MTIQVLRAHGILLDGGLGGGDTYAYWTAGAHVLAGLPLYVAGPGYAAAYLYPPPLAQVFAPLSVLPLTVVVWLWRAVMVVCLRIACGSWRAAGVALLIWPPVISELDAGNVHLLIAASVAMAIRGRPWAVAPVALTKFASLAAFPLALSTAPRRLTVGAAVATGIAAVSFALLPSAWADWIQAVFRAEPVLASWYDIGAAVPLPARLAAAGFVALLAIRWPRLAGVAATLALPILWFHGLSTLVACAARPAPRS